MNRRINEYRLYANLFAKPVTRAIRGGWDEKRLRLGGCTQTIMPGGKQGPDWAGGFGRPTHLCPLHCVCVLHGALHADIEPAKDYGHELLQVRVPMHQEHRHLRGCKVQPPNKSPVNNSSPNTKNDPALTTGHRVPPPTSQALELRLPVRSARTHPRYGCRDGWIYWRVLWSNRGCGNLVGVGRALVWNCLGRHCTISITR